MKAERLKVVELIYELRVDGQVVDRTVKERPLGFIFGTGSLLQKFEDNIEGLEPGAQFGFTLSPEEAYGVYNPELVIELPVAAFEVDGKMRDDLMVVGNVIPLVNSAGGVVPGKVLEVGELFVKVDINHPMAGKTLNFSGEILSVRDATEKELEEGLHGEKVHHCHHCHHCGGEEGGCHGEEGCSGHCHDEDGEGCEGGCKGGCHCGE